MATGAQSSDSESRTHIKLFELFDTDGSGAGHPNVRTWEKMGYLSGTVPMIGLTAGWCYAGNAAILGVTDIIIATEDALIAMGGPATIEGTDMGTFLPEEG